MPDMPNMEIPDAMRQMAERNVDQARNAYLQLMDMGRKAQGMMLRSSGAMTEGVLEIQYKIARFAEQNIEASFKLAGELARARDMKEYFEIQSRHAQQQMQIYAAQSQELGKMMSDLAQKSQPKP